MIKRTGHRTKTSRKGSFDPKLFLNTDGSGHIIVKYRTGETVFSQGSPADVVLYILKGKVKLTVVSEQGKEAVNSSERRLARTLLLLANFDKGGMPEPIIGKISQETLAGIVGTTRSRISQFMNKFRKLGLIDYNGQIVVHNSLLNVVLNDNPQLKTRTEPSGRSSGRTANTA